MKRHLPIGIAALVLSALPASAFYADDNNNGLSDLWERTYNHGQLLPSTFDPQADADGDGWSNEKEALAGTDPFDGTAPAGLLAVELTHIPAFMSDVDDDGIAEPVTPEAIRITWPMIPGKLYALFHSPTLIDSWTAVDEGTFISDGSDVEFGFILSQIEGQDPPPDKLFWRVMVEDADSNNDGVTDAEQYQLDSDADGDGLTYLQELALETDPNNPDTDGDGILDIDDPAPTTPDTISLSAATTLLIWSPAE